MFKYIILHFLFNVDTERIKNLDHDCFFLQGGDFSHDNMASYRNNDKRGCK